jgi:ferredoxin-nitrate reductase
MGAIRWPCNKQYPRGAERLYEDLRFWTDADACESYGVDFYTGRGTSRADYLRNDPAGKAILRPVHWRAPPNPVSDDYPLLLITGRLVYHFHTRTKTARSEVLNARAPAAYVEIHPEDAAGLGIELGDVVEISSPHGRSEAFAMVVDTVRRGEVFAPFHYGRADQSANMHTWYARDAVSKQPHFKSSPVALRRLSFGEAEPWLRGRLGELTGASNEPFASRIFGDTVKQPS